MITHTDIKSAYDRIKTSGTVRKSPLEYSSYLSNLTGAEVYLKCDHLQPTGSFKVRGATNKLLMLSNEDKARGVVTASSGNHGMATALGASKLGIQATIYVPENASGTKLDGIKAMGATVIKVPGDCLLAEKTARDVARETQKPYISPYNDEDVIMGQGTVGVEIHDDCPDVSAVFASVGGGGLIGGTGLYLKGIGSNTEIIGAWPEVAQSMNLCLEKGEIYEPTEQETLSDGTAGGVEEGALTFPICQTVLDKRLTVTEDEIRHAMRLIADKERWMIEGAAGVAVAAFLKTATQFQGKKVAIILCGRNITLEKFLSAVS
ncbi:serine/threonine dehydratase [Kordiimonas sediminis]|uniref:Serine/threonine dehydratase n=1 Tax=Kordiimonas sediminis TaxID=1735581 RepID=A0A919AZL0_9PROT|nr:threonine/serine dehydratase [Kordiimonas sediminis]GHF31144.1 serine/threonine dehydratase [Kordiimonas sediminis]